MCNSAPPRRPVLKQAGKDGLFKANAVNEEEEDGRRVLQVR